MKSINATLAAAQKAPSGVRAIARATLADNGRLHPAHAFTDTYTGGATRGCHCATFIFRLRYKASGLNTLERQVITDPTVESQWETWTAFETDQASSRGFGCFWTGTYVVALWQDASDRKLYWRRSTDGSTWSAAQVAYDISPNAGSLGAVSGGASNSGAFVFYNGTFHWAAYDPAADTWAALNNSGYAFDAAYSLECAGLYDSANARHTFILNPVGEYAWARFALVVGHRSAGPTWSTPRPFYHAMRNNFDGLSLSQAQHGGLWWMALHRARGWGQAVYWLSCSDDGEHWEDPYPTAIAGEPYLVIVPAISGSTIYLATERSVYSSTPQTGWSNATVVRFNLLAGDARGLATPTRPRITVQLDNRAGSLAAPALNSILTVERGYHIAGTDYYVTAGTFYVTAWRFLAQDKLLEITASDAAGLLDTHLPDQTLAWVGETVQTIVTQLCARAGIHDATFDANALWSETVASFQHVAGQSARAALANLQTRASFDFAVQEDGSIDFYVPTASPAAGYTYGYGASQHQYWPGFFGERESPTYVQVIGEDATADADDSHNAAAIAAAGRRTNRILFDPRITTAADASDLADAFKVLDTEYLQQGQILAPANFSLEVGDVIDFGGTTQEADASPWRVTHIEESFNEHAERPFYQRVSLRGTA